jgi:hypothetical protein
VESYITPVPRHLGNVKFLVNAPGQPEKYFAKQLWHEELYARHYVVA